MYQNIEDGLWAINALRLKQPTLFRAAKTRGPGLHTACVRCSPRTGARFVQYSTHCTVHGGAGGRLLTQDDPACAPEDSGG